MNGLIKPSTPTKNIGSFFSLFNASGRPGKYGRPADRQTGRPADRQTGRPADRQTGKINWYKQTLLFAFLMICSNFVMTQNSFGQFDEGVIMDSILKIFPPDSTYKKNEVIIKFKDNALDLNKLCYSYSTSENFSNNGKKLEEVSLSTSLQQFLGAQRFSVDELVLDSSLKARLKMYGGDSLRRVTFANPCYDTLSLTRYGDTIPIVDYLWMVLILNNDTSVVPTVVWTNLYHQNQIDYVEPNCKGYVKDSDFEPNDYLFSKQFSLKPSYSNAKFAWQFTRGNPITKVAVIDDGIDYRHCDLGNGYWGDDYKVKWGVNMKDHSENFHLSSAHGTQVAGIIGAYTNRNTCVTFQGGVAGIAGGWKNDTLGLDEPGCSLIAYKVVYDGNDTVWMDQVMHSVLHASNKSIKKPYGEGVHIINCSFGWEVGGKRLFMKGWEEAMDVAFENGVVQVSSAGNSNNQAYRFPSTFEPHKMIRVGAADEQNRKAHYSNYGQQIDLLAPGGECVYTTPPSPSEIIHTTVTNPVDNLGMSEFKCFSYTSAAAPHVSGTVALLHSFALDSGWTFYPEDYEGIMKAAAKDVNISGLIPYKKYYDDRSGWGNLDLQKIFFMFKQGYRIYHFTEENNGNFVEGDFSEMYGVYVSNKYRNKPVTGGVWNVRRRPIYHTVKHSRRWFDQGGYKIYVWGRSGPHNGKHGWAFKKPPVIDEGMALLCQNGFTGIQSGYGGNFDTQNMIHDYENGFDIATNSHEFKFFTFQYKFDQLFGDFTRPLTPNLAMHYTVFAREITDTTTSVLDFENENGIKIVSNENQDVIYIYSDLIVKDNITVKIVNSMGIELQTSKNHISNRVILNTKGFASGVYFVVLTNGLKSVSKQFVIQK